MDTKYLEDLGLESDTIKQIMKENGKDIAKEQKKTELAESKIADYNEKTLKINELTKELKQLQGKSGEIDAYKEQLESLQEKYDTDLAAKQQEYDDFKTATETQKTVDTKKSLLLSQLESDGAKPKSAKLLAKEFDINALELDGDKIKDWENVSKSVKEEFADYFGTTQLKGTNVAEPPKGDPTESQPKTLSEALHSKYERK